MALSAGGAMIIFGLGLFMGLDANTLRLDFMSLNHRGQILPLAAPPLNRVKIMSAAKMMPEISHVLFNIFSPDDAIPECVQCNFCPLPPLAMTSITTTYRQRNVHLFDSTLEMRDCLAYLHAGD
ncbi:MAG: hypothetical protein FRX49_01570 [Trebouxia sp. A1-2]|nr:MAG: hypothetical protein FRX49_01570 [Trebouxia sp. A1-2]